MSNSNQSNAVRPERSSKAHPARSLAFFEFWPTWLMYLPVMLQWPLLALRYQSFTLPLLANPDLPLGGMVGASKAQLMRQARGHCTRAFLPWVAGTRNQASAESQTEELLARAGREGFRLPFVVKPDIGCRGAGVKRVSSLEELTRVIAHYPPGATFIAQRLARFEHEAGIFYVRAPDEPHGAIVSLTFKDLPSVIGNGRQTLAQLVEADARAGALRHLYEPRQRERWHQVVPRGEVVPLLFSASHCQGAVFTNGKTAVTPALAKAIDRIMQDLPNFHYGRLDVKYADLDSLRAGENLEVMEINGVSAEAIHIWDKNTRLSDALRTLMWQYRTLFRIGAQQRRRGYRTPGLRALWRAWRHEQALTRHYPETD